MHADVARRGLAAAAPDAPVLEVARELVGLASQGLRRLAEGAGEDESGLLEPVLEIVQRGTSPARELVERFEGPWRRRIERLVEYTRY
jgi:glutamate--cysteine ligase